MRIIKVPTNPSIYSSNVYLLLGDFNTLEDINTLIDAGGDRNLIKEIRKIYTGAGKTAVSRIILTHTHFDHTAGIPSLKEAFGSKVYAFGKDSYIDYSVVDGALIKVADTQLQVIHVPEHSSDSICLYEWDTKILFTGDTNFSIISTSGSYSKNYLKVLERLLFLGVKTMYPGHGSPILNGQDVLLRTYHSIHGRPFYIG